MQHRSRRLNLALFQLLPDTKLIPDLDLLTLKMLPLTAAGTTSCPRCSVRAASCQSLAPVRFALRTGTASGFSIASNRGYSCLSQQKRRYQCHAKKSKKKKRSSEDFEERPVDEDVEAAALDSTETETAEMDEAAQEALEEELLQEQEQQQYQAEPAAPPPQASAGGSDMVRLGALGLGAVALIAAVVFAIKRFSKQKLPEEETVRISVVIHSVPTAQLNGLQPCHGHTHMSTVVLVEAANALASQALFVNLAAVVPTVSCFSTTLSMLTTLLLLNKRSISSSALCVTRRS